MNENQLYNIKISEYIELLKTNSDPKLSNEIDSFLNSKISGVSGGMDLQLFQLQKDLLLIQAKLLIANLEFDEVKIERYSKRVEQLRKELKDKINKKGKDKPNRYKSFLEWILSLKKYYGSDIDLENDLMYLISATEQMMKFYANQNEQIEKQKKR